MSWPNNGRGCCLSCYSAWAERNPACPTCKQPTHTEDLQRNMPMERMIGRLVVRCPNRDKPCAWAGELGRREYGIANECLFVWF